MVSLSLTTLNATPALHVLRGTRADDRILAECELSQQDLALLGASNLGLFAGGKRFRRAGCS